MFRLPASSPLPASSRLLLVGLSGGLVWWLLVFSLKLCSRLVWWPIVFLALVACQQPLALARQPLAPPGEFFGSVVRRNGEAPRHWHGTATHAAQRAAAVTFSRSSRWRSPASQECRVVAAALLQVAVTQAFRLAASPAFRLAAYPPSPQHVV